MHVCTFCDVFHAGKKMNQNISGTINPFGVEMWCKGKVRLNVQER